MLKISPDFFENTKNPLTSLEEYRSRKPIIEYNISIYSSFDFEVWESEQEICIIKCQKNDISDASEFIINVIRILEINNYPAFKVVESNEKDITKIINEMNSDLKYDLNFEKKIVDFLILGFEWDNKEILLETENQFVYFRWSTTA